jgi:hypothetical protein
LKPLPRRHRLAFELIGACVLTSALVSIVTIVIWEQTYFIPEAPNMSQWTPLDDLVGTVLFIPFGFLIYWLRPAGWLFWLGFGTSLLARNRLLFAVSIAGSAWFGYLWPAHFHGIIGI